MEFIFYILIMLCLVMELSKPINTKNILKKVALWLIILGCAIHIAEVPNQLAELGIFCYLLIDLFACLLTNRKP